MSVISFVIVIGCLKYVCVTYRFSVYAEHLMALSYQSQNKTSVLFAQVYRGHASEAHGPLSALYDDIRALINSDPDYDSTGEDLSSPPPRNLVDSAKRFFRDVFPVAYHKVLALEGKQFTIDYEGCLKVAYETVQPFGDVPQKVWISQIA